MLSVAASLQAKELGTAPVVVACAVGVDYLVALLACFFSGVIAVPMPEWSSGLDGSRWKEVLAKVKPAAALVSSGVEGVAADRQGIALIDVSRPAIAPGAWRKPASSDDAIAVLQFTSGSTGNPKGVMVTHGMLRENRAMIRDAFGHDDDWRCVTWLPPWHDMGLIGGLLQPLAEGMTAIILPPAAVVQRPLRWLTAISHYRATVSGGPTFGYAACVERIDPSDIAGLDLRSWKLAYCGAEPVRPKVLAGFSAMFAKAGFDSRALYPCYGLAEATLFVTGAARGRGIKSVRVDDEELRRSGRVVFDKNGREFVSCGWPWRNSRIAIRDTETGDSLPERVTGEICVSGRHATERYWAPGAEADPPLHCDIGLRTGDLGFLHQNELYIVGRLKDLIIIRGAKYHPEDIEVRASESLSSLASHAAVAFAVQDDDAERAVLLIEIRRSDAKRLDLDKLSARVRADILRNCGLRLDVVQFVPRGTIPRTTSGKPERYKSQKAFQGGDWPVTVCKTATTSKETADVT